MAERLPGRGLRRMLRLAGWRGGRFVPTPPAEAQPGGPSSPPACLVGGAPSHGVWIGVLGPSNWVGAVSAYNQGDLHGAWLDLAQVDAITAWDAALAHLRSTSEETGEVRIRVLDAMGFGQYLGQHPSGEDVVAVARVLQELAEEALPAFEAWARLTDWEPGTRSARDAVQRFRGAYLGSFVSLQEWGWRELEDSGLLGPVPPTLHPFIDAAAWARSRFRGTVQSAKISAERLALFLL